MAIRYDRWRNAPDSPIHASTHPTCKLVCSIVFVFLIVFAFVFGATGGKMFQTI